MVGDKRVELLYPAYQTGALTVVLISYMGEATGIEPILLGPQSNVFTFTLRSTDFLYKL